MLYGYRWGYSANDMASLATDEASIQIASKILAADKPKRIYQRRKPLASNMYTIFR
jgi:hypothetical protein